MFIDLKVEIFFKRIILEVKFCFILELIFFFWIYKNYNVGICFLVGLYSYNIRFFFIFVEVFLEIKNNMVKFLICLIFLCILY